LKKGETYSDYAAGQKSLEFRKQNAEFKGLSFETISSSGPMAAVIHYSPPIDSTQIVKLDQVYLLDSGGQYFEGTTDTTRTLHFGTPNQEEKTAFTLVLKGHIALATAVFPEGTTGNLIESQARRYLWQYGLDYRHGTGHGIGSYLNVHENPIGISQKGGTTATLRPGNLISNEPGYYEDGKYGIRIENIILCKVINTPHKFGGIRYLGFETITQAPLGQNLMDLNLLTVEEKKWINEYHAQVYETLRPYFKEGERALQWLRRETLPIF
jgi:Xaa-Pro aminopeptidase